MSNPNDQGIHTPDPENLAQTLARELPKPITVLEQEAFDESSVTHIAVPKGFDIKAIDNEHLQEGPRRITARAELDDAESFLSYVNLHDSVSGCAAVWCTFNPVTYALQFEAVFDEHGLGSPGWRKHRAVFKPRLSVEWGIWVDKHNRKEHGQLAFAEFIEANEKDIAAGDRLPSSLDMQTMATAFEINADKRFKSKVRTQSGGVELEYVDTDDGATVERMKLFERFQIGIPVFWTIREASDPVSAWPIQARLKYRVNQGAVLFWYDLIRPDIVHESAALALIRQIDYGLGNVPLRMGSCT